MAVLATVFASTVSADVRAQQDQLQNTETTATQRFGVCETPGVAAENNLPPGVETSLASLPVAKAAEAKAGILSTLRLACEQSVHGFENAYLLTFFASIGALILGAFLPGWPGKWGGRTSAQGAMPGGH